MRSPDNQSLAPIRVLHIGNIANNAYLNAAMLNRAGYDCDVLVYSYYHCMGCPEWEDSDFSGTVDEFAPDWNRVDRAGFRRPRWFAQGPTFLALQYLLARRTRPAIVAWAWWVILELGRPTASLPRYRWLNSFFGLAHKAISIGFGVFRRARALLLKLYRWPQGVVRSPGLASLNISGEQKPRKEKASDWRDQRFEKLINIFAEQFPDRPDCLSATDFDHFRAYLPFFRKLFASYDVIHCYGSDPLWPLLTGNMPYVAFEHGTIRHLPFQDNAVGRLTALAYNQADRAIITNCDCHVAAQRLKCRHYQFVPHPLNEKWIEPGIGATLRRSLLAELDADFLCFHPPRQHWKPWRELVANGSDEDPCWFKANDIFYEGFARFIREVAPRAAIVAVEWGATVDKSKALLGELGVERVKWIAPQHSRNMLRYTDACDLLVDQFWVGAFGTTMPKGMPLAKPAMSYVDPTLHKWCMAELPPILNARTPDDVFALLRRGYEDREWLADIGRRGREWYKRYHSNATITAALGRLYREAIAERGTVTAQ